ncbi:trk system potassium uptake protein TrkH [Chryseomicrobium aureum]|uniref:TrkH family potassium uptake protein n=1 Tax=Chryseomicrobium aureum TaxID=1441723 RepID=UPI00195682E4|nr:TrkH family potassium uptake protein [Chryseomicrobium aureum]MBM7705800.1 trk system potassium uptake protein TrkH [Chryseomicrobium aureum]
MKKWHYINPENYSPAAIIALSFLVTIFTGTALLNLPIAHIGELSVIDAFFFATSATTVTGLGVADTATTFTTFGEVVLMFLMQFGGIGLMTFSVAILILLKKKISLKQRLYLRDSYNQASVGGLVKLTKAILLFVVSVQSLAFVLLTLHWNQRFELGDAAYFAAFHVISAFNNAGFSLFSDNLIGFQQDPFTLFLISNLFIIGGIGFIVVLEVVQKKRFREWSLHTKLMISGTLVVNALAMVLFFLLEFHNPQTLANLAPVHQWTNAYFAAVTPRTAGFNTLDYSVMTDSSLLLTVILMFIGGGTASTASGIKLTTFIVLILATLAFFRNDEEPFIFGRTIKKEVVMRSFAITVISSLLIGFLLFFMTVIEKSELVPLIFEVVSAFGTVGLSMGITADLSDTGKVLLCAAMFIGRIGPLTLFYLLARPKNRHYRFAYDQVYTG